MGHLNTPSPFIFIVPPDQSGQRLDKVLASLPEILSRTRATQLIVSGHVQHKGKIPKPSTIVKTGDTLQILWPQAPTTDLVPWAQPLDVLFEDEDLLVINKPSGLVVHPAAGHAQDTLVNILLHHVKNLSMGFHEQRPGIVHRLDKDTSGLLVVAKNDETHQHLSAQFKSRSIHREYWALVFGDFKMSQKTIISFLARHPSDRKRFASSTKGKKAITHVEKVQDFPCGLTFVRCRLETGRTHQIRVHLSESGHPLIGDTLYGAKSRLSGIKNEDLRTSLQNMDRIGLHAHKLGFIHPRTQALLMFECDWPENLKKIFTLLSGRADFHKK